MFLEEGGEIVEQRFMRREYGEGGGGVESPRLKTDTLRHPHCPSSAVVLALFAGKWLFSLPVSRAASFLLNFGPSR